jgi:hypothetical protein
VKIYTIQVRRSNGEVEVALRAQVSSSEDVLVAGTRDVQGFGVLHVTFYSVESRQRIPSNSLNHHSAEGRYGRIAG